MTTKSAQNNPFEFPQFGIDKPGYQCNPEITFDQGDARKYWTGERLQLNGRYQYDVYVYAAKLAARRRCSTLLDLGSGPAVKVKKLFQGKLEKIVLADQPNTEEIALENVPDATFVPVDLNKASELMGNSPFDLIICADVIEHVSRPDHILQTIKNNLANDGRFVISTPNRDIRRGASSLRPDNRVHVREWNLPEFRGFIESAGLKVLDQFPVPIIKMNPLQSIVGKLTKAYHSHPVFSGGQLVVGKLN